MANKGGDWVEIRKKIMNLMQIKSKKEDWWAVTEPKCQIST